MLENRSQPLETYQILPLRMVNLIKQIKKVQVKFVHHGKPINLKLLGTREILETLWNLTRKQRLIIKLQQKIITNIDKRTMQEFHLVFPP